MTHLAHLVRWDLRRLRVVLAVWALVIIASLATSLIRPVVVADARIAETVEAIAGLLWVTGLVLTFALVSFVMHGDAAVGTTAFWMTRPVPPVSLAGAKLLVLVAALIVLPAVTQGIVLAVNKMPWAASAGVIADSVAFRVTLIIALVLAAALTRNLARFALLCGALLLTIVGALAIFLAVQMGRFDDTALVAPEPTVESFDSTVIFDVLFVIGVVAAVAVQYVTRLRRRSVAVAVIATAIAVAVSDVWPGQLLKLRLIVPDWAGDPATLSLAVDPATISTNKQNAFFSESRREWNTVNGAVRITPPERAWMADVRLRSAQVSLGDGSVLRSPGSWPRPVLLSSDESTRLTDRLVIRDVLAVNVLSNEPPAPPDEAPRPENLPVLFLMREQELSRYRGARGQYHGRFIVILTELAIEGVLPVRPGAVHQNRAYRLVIDGIVPIGGEPAIVARESQARSTWDLRPWTRYRFYLRNRTRNEAVEVSDMVIHRASLFRFLPFGNFSVGVGGDVPFGFSSRGALLSFRSRYNARGETIDIDEQWLTGAELVVIRQTQEGSVERTLAISDFPL